MVHYLRNPSAAIAAGSRAALVVSGSESHALTEIDGEQLSRLLERTKAPALPETLLDLVDQAELDLLVGLGVLLAGSKEALQALITYRPDGGGSTIADRIVVGLSGAIGAAEMVPLIRRLRSHAFSHVDIIMTAAAQRFVVPSVFESYGIPVWTDELERCGDVRVPHIRLAKEADVVLIMPASAHTLHKLALAECSDLLSLVVTATRAPVVIVPAMNEAMWQNAGVQRNVRYLREAGYWVVEPTHGVEVASDFASEMTLGAAGVSGETLLPLLAAICETAKRDRSAGAE